MVVLKYNCNRCKDLYWFITCACKCGNLRGLRDRWGNIRSFINHHNTKGHLIKNGITYDTRGYELVHSPNHPNKMTNNYIRKHRQVMEAHLGRYLTKDEVVHHIDKNIKNNNIDNLELIQNQSIHRKEKHILNMNDRSCSNPKCNNPTETYIAKNGRPRWYTSLDKPDKFECSTCYERRRKNLIKLLQYTHPSSKKT